MTNQPEPVSPECPHDYPIYYDAESDNFYCSECHQGMGRQFYADHKHLRYGMPRNSRDATPAAPQQPPPAESEPNYKSVPTLEHLATYLAYQYPATCGDRQLSQVCKEVASLRKSLDESKAELAAITTGIRKEFTIGELSGDILQDFATFIYHHGEVEKQLTTLRAENERLRSALEAAQNYARAAVDKGTSVSNRWLLDLSNDTLDAAPSSRKEGEG
jgi:hypothetical protein